MKKIIYILTFCCILTRGYCQGIKLDSARITTTTNTFMVVSGGVTIENESEILNDGVLTLTGDWENNASSDGLDQLGAGRVIFNGDFQNIFGSEITTFHNLELMNEGTLKEASIDVFVSNTLNLSDAILALNNAKFHVTNPTSNAVIWNGGFITGNSLSSYFLRSTNSIDTYDYPMGSADLTNNYRPIIIEPITSDSSVFGVRLGSINPSFEVGTSEAGSSAPFDTSKKDADLGNLNEAFFHTIYRFSGEADANATIYFFENDLEEVTTVGKWNTAADQWINESFQIENTPAAPARYNFPERKATSRNVLSYEDDVYSLATFDLILPTTITPNGDGLNDFLVIENLESFPQNEIQIFNRWGEIVYSASPYLNNWDGVNTSGSIKVQGTQVQEDTYFYVLKLTPDSEPIKNFIELIRN